MSNEYERFGARLDFAPEYYDDEPIYYATARFKQQKPRPTYWYDWRTGDLYFPSGASRDFGPGRAASDLLQMARTGTPSKLTVYLSAGETNETAPPHSWYREPVALGWKLAYRHEQPPLRTAIYTRDDMPGFEVTFRHTSAWFRRETSLARVRSAYGAVARRVRRDWWDEGGREGHVLLLGTPAQTGLDLLARALPKPRDYPNAPAYRYPIPPLDLWASLHTWGYQHRLELCMNPEQETAPGWWYMDGRFAYAAHTRLLPCWLEAHDQGVDRFERDRWGWYLVQATVPQGWKHLGILKDPYTLAWPSEPGQVIETWADSHELKLALDSGWDVKIRERWLFNAQRAGSDPLRLWTKRLVDAYLDAQRDPLGDDEGIGPLLKEAYGHLLYDTIGTFKRSRVEERVTLPVGAELPVGAYDVELTADGWEARIARPLSGWQLGRAQVGWWVALTSRQRNHGLMRRVLLTPREHVGAIRTDAAHLFCTRPDLEGIWHDFGRVGDYRVKGSRVGDVPMPHSEGELFELMHGDDGKRVH